MGKSVKNYHIAIIMSLVFLVVALVLECIPGSIIMPFSAVREDGSAGKIYCSYCYFSTTPFAYALFTPMITGIITIVLIGLFIFRIFRYSKLVTVCTILPLVGGVTAITHLFLQADVNTITPSGIFVSSCLFMAFILNLLDYLHKKYTLNQSN